MSAALARAAEPTSRPADASGMRATVRESMAPLGDADSAESQRLREAIDKLKATQISPRRDWPVSNPPAVRNPLTDAAGDAESENHAGTTTQPAQADARAADALDADQLAALRALKGLPADEAALLGAALQKTGHLEEAYGFFEQAVQASEGAEQAYLLLQMAHCKRSSDAALSQTLYRRVAAEFAGTPWATVAAAYDSMLDFTRLHRPGDVIRDATSESVALPPSPPPARAASRQTLRTSR